MSTIKTYSTKSNARRALAKIAAKRGKKVEDLIHG